MNEVHVSLPVRNESGADISLCLEPYCESFRVKPRQRVVVHAVCMLSGGSPPEFVVGYSDSTITVYAPGAPSALIDAYVTLDGTRLSTS
jgi:hypothetical protein